MGVVLHCIPRNSGTQCDSSLFLRCVPRHRRYHSLRSGDVQAGSLENGGLRMASSCAPAVGRHASGTQRNSGLLLHYVPRTSGTQCDSSLFLHYVPRISGNQVGISGTQCDSSLFLRCVPWNSGMQRCDGSIPRCVPRRRRYHSMHSEIFLRNERAQRKIISKWPFIPRITCATGVWCGSAERGSAGRDREQQQALTDATDKRKWSKSQATSASLPVPLVANWQPTCHCNAHMPEDPLKWAVCSVSTVRRLVPSAVDNARSPRHRERSQGAGLVTGSARTL